MENLKYIIESLLFVSDTPIMLKQIHFIMPDIKMSQIRKAVEELTQEYNERVGSFYLSNVAGGIQLRSRPVYKEWIKRFIRSRPIRLSRAALEALAIVAYKQPVTRSEVDKIRGVDSGAIMRSLVDNKLIRIIGRKEVPGRPMLYTTSKRFLEVFDLNDLKDLPAPDDLEINDDDQAKLAEKFDIQVPTESDGASNAPSETENVSETTATPEMIETSEVPPETPEASEKSEVPPETPEASEISEVPPETPEASETSEVPPETPEASETSEVSPETPEAIEESERSETSQSPEISEIHLKASEEHKCSND
ncbi:chromosome segregation and condensation protein ScpB [Candidatus Magnetomorum sp. HK-1]|nr:chromosome segregation and condensation protein ScpB [Candidatus Magnetomorum sp. HK-1]